MRFSQRHGKAILRHRNKIICEDVEESDGLLSASHDPPARAADREGGEWIVNSWKLYIGSPIYHTWSNMKMRCLNPRNPSYRFYGARGIGVCERWLTFSNFLADMGERPE